MTYFDREPGVLHEIEAAQVLWTALGHRRRRLVERLYDGVLQAFHAFRPVLHVTTYPARNLQYR